VKRVAPPLFPGSRATPFIRHCRAVAPRYAGVRTRLVATREFGFDARCLVAGLHETSPIFFGIPKNNRRPSSLFFDPAFSVGSLGGVAMKAKSTFFEISLGGNQTQRAAAQWNFFNPRGHARHYYRRPIASKRFAKCFRIASTLSAARPRHRAAISGAPRPIPGTSIGLCYFRLSKSRLAGTKVSLDRSGEEKPCVEKLRLFGKTVAVHARDWLTQVNSSSLGAASAISRVSRGKT